MFDFFRRMIVPIIVVALVGFLATIIFSWGADITSRQQYDSANLAAVINGEEVSWTAYSKIYDNLYQTEQQKTDDDISEAKKNELHNTAWSQLQFELLILQEVDKYNITVTDDELYDFLKFSPPQDFINASQFQTNGQFDYQKYINALADPNFASFWASSDQYFRTEIKKLKLQEIIVQSAHVSENEVKDYFISLNEKIKVGMINVNYAKYSRLTITSTDEEALAYYNSNTDKYKVGERAVLKLVSFDKKPSQFDWDAAETRITQIYDSISNGSDFAEMAKNYSQDGSATRGGDLGLFTQGQMVPEFDQLAFSMKDGDLSKPFKTQFGWHIMKHFGFEKEDNVNKARASHILIKVATSQETLDRADETLRNFQYDALELGFEESATKHGLTTKSTIPFEKGSGIQFLGRDVEATEFAFSNELNSISQVFENSSLQFVVQLVEKQTEGVLGFEECKKTVETNLRTDKIIAMCVDTAAVIWSEIQAGTSFDKAAKNHSFEYTESDEFVREGYVKGLSTAPKAIGAAFAMENEGDMTGPINYNQGTMLMKLLSKTPVDLNSFTTQKDSLGTVLLSTKQQDLFGRWYDNLITSSEIVNNIQTIRAANQNY